MSNTVTLDQAIDTALQLPPEQREMLIDILRSRQIETRREEIAADARKSITAFREGKLKAQSAEEAITELHQALENAE
ncbi:MAG: hypothetical protein M5U01_00240 [Ardenticatenaceae bacterium]|nr:hypothetical protein [Ardenticatenaceae bacterium]HBY95258.1 hypothetical protein [Chloroflexota bacterium]